MLLSMDVEISVALVQVEEDGEAKASGTAPVPAPLSRTRESGIIGRLECTSSMRRAAAKADVRPTFDE